MRVRLLTFWETLRSTYWFLPSVLAILAVVLAWATLELDTYFLNETDVGVQWLYAGKADSALSLLSTVAGSMITVAGVSFSITIVALSLASSQFGPRLLDNFMRDRGNQVVLGTFIATFIFCLLIMRAIRSGDATAFVPPISVTMGLVLAGISLGVLIYFIHHVSASIQVETVISKSEAELDAAIERLYPLQQSTLYREREARSEDDVPDDFSSEAEQAPASRQGYIQSIDFEALLELSTEEDILLMLERRRGEFVADDQTLAHVRPADALDEDLVEQINAAFIIGKQRLQRDDVEYVIGQIVQIAVRALSPGINDPFTAMACLDRLGAALSNLAQRATPSSFYYDDDDNLRIISQTVTFTELVNEAFDPIRQYGSNSVGVVIRMLETLAVVAAQAQNDQQRAALRRQAVMVRRAAAASVPEENDRQEIDAQYQLTLELLDGAGP